MKELRHGRGVDSRRRVWGLALAVAALWLPAARAATTPVNLAFDDEGAVKSLREKSTGRELVERRVPFVTVQLADGRWIDPVRMRKTGRDRMTFAFPDKAGEAVLSVKPFDGGWTYTVESLTVADWRTFAFCRVAPACGKWFGGFANALSDETSVVCVRSYGLAGEPRSVGRDLRVEVKTPFSPVGLSAGLAAGPRKSFPQVLRAMTVAAGVPRSDCGGAWSLGSEQARRSYVFASVRDGDIDWWIDLVKRGGFSIIHLGSEWSDCLGPYPVRKRAFPGGLEEMKRAADRVHAAGLQLGIHSLTGCISPRADWISPVCSTDLVADATYTLAAPLAPDAAEMVVAERPIDAHSLVYAYSSNGNVLRLGGELVQYAGIRREKPYAFTGLVRGAFGTRTNAATVASGARVDYLHQRYNAFYPNPDGELADRIAGRLAEVYNTCGLDDFYFDGSEGMGTRYGIDAMRHGIFARFKPNNGHSPSVEASCDGANNWWFQTRMGTWDYCYWSPKRFHDRHLDQVVDRARRANFLEPQMGWWCLLADNERTRGHYLDEAEYFAAKNAGLDLAMSVQVGATRPLGTSVRRQLTVLGWYEHARLARCLSPRAEAYLAAPRTEARLRQNARGAWELTETACDVRRCGEGAVREWTVTGDAACPAALRVEALYAADSETDGVTVCERVESANEQKDGAWLVAHRAFDFPGFDAGDDCRAFGVWVKGDGSGALLDLQFTSPRDFTGAVSDHYVKLDFTGWRLVTVLLRERDVDRRVQLGWPKVVGRSDIWREAIKTRHLESVSAYMEKRPASGKSAVEIGRVVALRQVARPVEKSAVVVNGVRHEVPFVLASGECAELEGTAWTHYSAGGDRLEVVAAKAQPKLKKGPNAVAWASAEGARAEVTVFALGATYPAFVPKLTAAMRKELRYEGVMPFEYAPAKGLSGPRTLAVRPGERAGLAVEICGPCARPTLAFGEGAARTVCAFGTDLAADEQLVCRDGSAWKVVRPRTGAVVRSGTLAQPLPALDTSVPMDFTAEVPDGAVCVVDLMKDYGSWRPSALLSRPGGMEQEEDFVVKYHDEPKGKEK